MKITRLKGSSLAEVLVALAVASVIFVIGTLVFLNLSGPQDPSRKTEYRWAARTLLNETISEGSASDKTEELLGMKFTRQVKVLNPSTGLAEIKIIVLSSEEEVVLERTKIERLNAGN